MVHVKVPTLRYTLCNNVTNLCPSVISAFCSGCENLGFFGTLASTTVPTSAMICYNKDFYTL